MTQAHGSTPDLELQGLPAGWSISRAGDGAISVVSPPGGPGLDHRLTADARPLHSRLLFALCGALLANHHS